MKNIFRSFYQVITSPVEAGELSEDFDAEFVLSEEGERVGLFSSLFGELGFNGPRVSV